MLTLVSLLVVVVVCRLVFAFLRKNKLSVCALQMATSLPLTQEKVHRAKMSIENFYANLINQYEEREERYDDDEDLRPPRSPLVLGIDDWKRR